MVRRRGLEPLPRIVANVQDRDVRSEAHAALEHLPVDLLLGVAAPKISHAEHREVRTNVAEPVRLDQRLDADLGVAHHQDACERSRRRLVDLGLEVVFDARDLAPQDGAGPLDDVNGGQVARITLEP